MYVDIMYNVCTIKKRKNRRTRGGEGEQPLNHAAGTQSLSNPVAQGGAFKGNEALLI